MAPCLVLLAASTASAQTTRQATNLATVLTYPSYFHLRPIVIVGTVAQQQNGDLSVTSAGDSVHLVPMGTAPDGLDEIRGEFWDLGRMKVDDPRLATIDLRTVFHVDPDGAWPRPGTVTAIMASAVTPAQPPVAPSIRSIVLEPARYLDQQVTVTGQYEGRNLMGELPDAPGVSRYDFVLRSADAAIWVSNVRPKGKDPQGKDFELSLDARIDTGRWLQVTGTLRQGRGLLWVDGDAGSLKTVPAPTDEDLTEETPVRVPAAPPPEVLFSVPSAGEAEVAATTNVRIQFSRDIDPSTVKGHVQVSYVGGPAAGEAPAPTMFSTSYNAGRRELTVTFAAPFAPFRTVKLELTDGILGTDKQPLKPWTLTFSVGR